MSTSSPYPNTELPASKRKQTFLSADLASVLAFEQRAARPHFRAHNLDVCVCLSASQTCPTLCDLMDCSHQAYLSMKFSRQEYWSGYPFPTPGDLPDPGIKPTSLSSPVLAGRFFTISANWILANASIVVIPCRPFSLCSAYLSILPSPLTSGNNQFA